jgi:hypothetical protein
MKKDWVSHCLHLSQTRADFYSGARKILQNVHFTLRPTDDLTLADAGYTKSKMSMLTRNYLHEESRAMAISLWSQRLEKNKYGSVGFTCYNHFVKGNVSGASKRGSVFGPCIQAVTLTLTNDKSTVVDVFYRTTELFKKFPADLVFICDVLLPPFGMHPKQINFHFANVTAHPMYYVTIIPHLKNPIAELDKLKRADVYFFNWVVKWTARYLCPQHFRGIEKFSQAMRVRKDALDRIDPRTLKILRRYLIDNHPGYRNDYVDPDEEE